MTKAKTTGRHRGKQDGPWTNDDRDSSHSRQESGRKYLKNLDRELQRFSARVAGLETASALDEPIDKADLLQEAEELYRETLLLRSEIREALATKKGTLDDAIESIDDTWEQLRESFEELKESLRPSRNEPTALRSTFDDEEDRDLDDLDYEDEPYELELLPEHPERRIHRPRVGPKR